MRNSRVFPIFLGLVAALGFLTQAHADSATDSGGGSAGTRGGGDVCEMVFKGLRFDAVNWLQLQSSESAHAAALLLTLQKVIVRCDHRHDGLLVDGIAKTARSTPAANLTEVDLDRWNLLGRDERIALVMHEGLVLLKIETNENYPISEQYLREVEGRQRQDNQRESRVEWVARFVSPGGENLKLRLRFDLRPTLEASGSGRDPDFVLAGDLSLVDDQGRVLRQRQFAPTAKVLRIEEILPLLKKDSVNVDTMTEVDDAFEISGHRYLIRARIPGAAGLLRRSSGLLVLKRLQPGTHIETGDRRGERFTEAQAQTVLFDGKAISLDKISLTPDLFPGVEGLAGSTGTLRYRVHIADPLVANGSRVFLRYRYRDVSGQNAEVNANTWHDPQVQELDASTLPGTWVTIIERRPGPAAALEFVFRIVSPQGRESYENGAHSIWGHYSAVLGGARADGSLPIDVVPIN